MQRARRTNPYPFTWEIPVAAVVATVLLLVLGVHAGRAVANLVAGGGLTLPSRETLFTSVPGVLGGGAGAGLTGTAAHLAGATAVRVWVGVAEAMVLTLTVWVGKVGLGRWGPGRIQGMASREEAARLLGRSRLRKVGAVVRPDLYGRER
ncbi:hypothetical protein SAMN04489867_3144 [Pedococcus dokdonensis]|uniref:Uncharacterized protein n=1 Tax=Pedococcus dokdonensis TaxID=443156 RepID=A0A1H0U5F9_9MICO|nr:hypothetical protein [Pedococcus dokdonensis]SDP61414.1 hypothetical protein SAMN04489867_3144 [Pedococcus dokdonensis]